MKLDLKHQTDILLPACSTLPAFLEWLYDSYADRPALSWFTRRREEMGYTYRELIDLVRVLQISMDRQGMREGAHVAILSENSADWIVTFLAAAANGCIAVCADTEQSDEGIRDMICRADTRFLFLSPTFLPICLPLLTQGRVERIVLMGGLSSEERVDSLDDLYQLGRELRASGAPVPAPAVGPDDTAEIVFTSGTTSKSKMVMLSHNAILQNMKDAARYVDLLPKVFCSLPFYHAYGLTCGVLDSFILGSHLFINGDLKTVMRDLHLARPDTMLTVPLMVEAIHNQLWLKAEQEGKADALRKLMRMAGLCRRLHLPVRFKALDQLREQIVGSLHLIVCGGAHLSREISEEFDLMGIQVLQGYGITEHAPLISVNRNTANKMGSVGVPMDSCELRLVDGEVWVRGASVMQGYYKDPEATAQAVVDGWFRTGDLGYLDRDGFLYLTGRKKNLIVFKNGKKVSPEKLEELIAPLPLVREVMVSGSANGSSADDVKLTASIYPDPERTKDMSSYDILEQLQSEIDRINRDLPTYQQIQMVSIREKEFAKTGTRKIKRHSD